MREQRQQPRQLHLKPDVVVGDINSACRILAKQAGAGELGGGEDVTTGNEIEAEAIKLASTAAMRS